MVEKVIDETQVNNVKRVSILLEDLTLDHLISLHKVYTESDSAMYRLYVAAIDTELQRRSIYQTEGVLTAMCLWEAALELKSIMPELDAHWEEHGTVVMRSEIAELVASCEREWINDQVGGCAHEPFDWEHCPRFLKTHYMKEFCISPTDVLME